MIMNGGTSGEILRGAEDDDAEEVSLSEQVELGTRTRGETADRREECNLKSVFFFVCR